MLLKRRTASAEPAATVAMEYYAMNSLGPRSTGGSAGAARLMLTAWIQSLVYRRAYQWAHPRTLGACMALSRLQKSQGPIDE